MSDDLQLARSTHDPPVTPAVVQGDPELRDEGRDGLPHAVARLESR